ncbi:MAG: biopolymer transporter ExbD, partial [Leptolyngbya sp. SIO3F4]|nr:biopolymer transporter ExbD [Leptolyngbya sp. SIO3F4]
MGLRTRQENKGVPEVNLVPMMDVLMTVLTFFVIISMELSGVQIFGVSLP